MTQINTHIRNILPLPEPLSGTGVFLHIYSSHPNEYTQLLIAKTESTWCLYDFMFPKTDCEKEPMQQCIIIRSLKESKTYLKLMLTYCYAFSFFAHQHHIKYQHLLKKKYVCPHPSCGRLFRLQKQLLRHAKHHTGEHTGHALNMNQT